MRPDRTSSTASSPRRNLRSPALIALCLLAACADPARPNVLLVTLDTTRADVIGAYGGAAPTPTWDRMAQEGVRFDRAYSVTPLTIPSHASMFTGQYPPRHGVRDNGDFFLGDEAVTLAERLSGAGYQTMAAVGAEVTSHHWGFAQGFGTFFDDLGPGNNPANRWRVERTGDKVVDDALSWLNQDKRHEQPWFAWVHLFDAHHPYEPPEPFASASPGKPYLGEVSFADAQVGRILARLDEQGVLANTWVVMVADHGESLGAHGEGMHGVLLYDPTTRIPMVVRGPPGNTPARVVDTPVSLVDLTPTILAITGVPPAEGIDGINLLPVLSGAAEADGARTVYVESLYAWHHYGWAPQEALVTHQDKLISSTTPELYSREDRAEAHNLASADVPRLTELEAQLTALIDSLTPANTAARADLSAERLEQLEALGYLTVSHSGSPTDGLPDPVRQLPVLGKLERARQAVRTGDFAAARLAVDEAIATDPGLTEARILQATLLGREGKLNEAIAVAEALDLAHPGSQPKTLRGTLYLQAGRLPEAAEVLRQAVETDPYQARAWSVYLRSLLLSEDPSLLAEAARGHSLLPDAAEIVGMYGVALAAAGQHSRAAGLLDRANTMEPNQPFINHARGMTYQAAGDVTRAEACFEEEIRLFSPAVASRRMLVTLYAEQKRYEEQLAQLTEVRRTERSPAASADDPGGTPETLHSIAQALFNLKRWDEAYTEVQRCRGLAPGYVGCALLEANVLKKLGRDAEALEAFERAKSLAE